MQRSVSVLKVAVFVTPHGYGHAARAVAVMDAMQRITPCRFLIFTSISASFFQATLGRACVCHRLKSDVGLVQTDAFRADIPATLTRLKALYPPRDTRIRKLCMHLAASGCRGVLCDIAPLGLVVARHAGLPSVLIENFTWPWIYRHLPEAAQLESFSSMIEDIDNGCSCHIQTEPLCSARQSDVPLPPISRPPRIPPEETLRKLALDPSRPVVFVTLGGIPDAFGFQPVLKHYRDIQFVLAGSADGLKRNGNVLELPRDSTIYHPDVVAAASVIVSKLGYSTVAEAYHNRRPLLYVPRPEFAESAVISRFVTHHMQAAPITEQALRSGAWVESIPALLESASAAQDVPRPNGAAEAAARVLHRLTGA